MSLSIKTILYNSLLGIFFCFNYGISHWLSDIQSNGSVLYHNSDCYLHRCHYQIAALPKLDSQCINFNQPNIFADIGNNSPL
jgi:hypothetical protein